MNFNNVHEVDLGLLNQRTRQSSAPDIMKTPVTDHTDALQFVGEALQLHIDNLNLHSGTEGEIMILEEATKLNQAIRDGADYTILGSQIDAFHEVISGLVKASSELVEGAQTQANEYAEELQKKNETQSKQSTGNPHIAVEAISDEVSRRAIAIEKSSILQEELEDQRAELEQEIGTIDELLKHSGDETDTDERKQTRSKLAGRMRKLDTDIKNLIETRDRYQQSIDELKRYDEAMKIVKKGLAPEIFEEDLTQ